MSRQPWAAGAPTCCTPLTPPLRALPPPTPAAGYSWLHKGAYACSRELCEGEYTERFVAYCMSRVELMRSNGVTPIIVFDGGRLPEKAGEEETRRRWVRGGAGRC